MLLRSLGGINKAKAYSQSLNVVIMAKNFEILNSRWNQTLVFYLLRYLFFAIKIKLLKTVDLKMLKMKNFDHKPFSFLNTISC